MVQTAKKSVKEQSFNLKKALSELRQLGLGVKEESEGIHFYNKEHEQIFDKVIGVLQNGKKISQKAKDEISSLLGEADDELKLVDDFELADWILKAEGFVYQTSKNLVPNDSALNGQIRTSPFLFTEKHSIQAEKAYEMLRNIGLNAQWQPRTHLNFWLLQREFNKKETRVINRTKRHPVSNILESLGVKGHEIEEGFYYMNNVKSSRVAIMNKALSGEPFLNGVSIVIENFKNSANDKYTVKANKKGFSYAEISKPNSEPVKSAKGRTLHPVSAACEKIGLSGNTRSGENYFYLNNVKTGILSIKGTTSVKRRETKTAKVFEQLKTICPEFEFTYKENSMRISYKQRSPSRSEQGLNQTALYSQQAGDTQQTTNTRKKVSSSKNFGKTLFETFSSEQWQIILQQVPAEEILKRFPQFAESKEDKKILDKIRKSYYLIEKSGLVAKTTNPEFLKEVDNV